MERSSAGCTREGVARRLEPDSFRCGEIRTSRIFLENALYNARTKAKEQDCWYESLRDLSVSLDKAVGIYLQLDDLDGALS